MISSFPLFMWNYVYNLPKNMKRLIYRNTMPQIPLLRTITFWDFISSILMHWSVFMKYEHAYKRRVKSMLISGCFWGFGKYCGIINYYFFWGGGGGFVDCLTFIGLWGRNYVHSLIPTKRMTLLPQSYNSWRMLTRW